MALGTRPGTPQASCHLGTPGVLIVEEDLIRALVIAGLAVWAGWGFMVGLKARQGGGS